MFYSGVQKIRFAALAGLVAMSVASLPAKADHGHNVVAPLAAFIALNALIHHRHHGHYRGHRHYRHYGHGHGHGKGERAEPFDQETLGAARTLFLNAHHPPAVEPPLPHLTGTARGQRHLDRHVFAGAREPEDPGDQARRGPLPALDRGPADGGLPIANVVHVPQRRRKSPG